MKDRTEAFDGALEVSPPVGEDQLGQIPAKRGVALLEAQGEAPIVMLTASDIRSRVRTRLAQPLEDARRKTADLREITRRVRWKLAAGHFEMDLRFLELARATWPDSYGELLAWKPAWFVQVDPHETFPHFQRTREIAGASGRCFGPFPGSRQADRFLQAIQDGFDLCRHVRCLRQAPHGTRCAYADMGRCLRVCDGTMPLEEYRRHVAAATEFAAGDRAEHLGGLKQAMAAAAAELAFERAARLKGRIDRLAELGGEGLDQARPLGEFRFVLVQPSGSRRQGKLFFVNGPSIAELSALKYPLVEGELSARLKAMAMQAERGAGPLDAAGQWRIGLVSSYLFAGPDRQGLMVRWSASLAAKELAEAIEGAAARLGLGAADKRNSHEQRERDEQGGTEAEKPTEG